jgi:hypothetical protein
MKKVSYDYNGKLTASYVELILLRRLNELEEHEKELRSHNVDQDVLDYSLGKRHGLSEAISIIRKLKEEGK